MNISIQRINTTSEDYNNVEQLMRLAFAPDERRDEYEQRSLTDGCSFFSVNSIHCDGKWAGFLSSWNFGRFLYIEHFAIQEDLRCMGVGSEVLDRVCASAGLPIFLEVDQEGVSSDASRRVSFYRLAGFNLWKLDYIQPAYGIGKKPVPMQIMSRGIPESPENLAILQGLLRSHVYTSI